MATKYYCDGCGQELYHDVPFCTWCEHDMIEKKLIEEDMEIDLD
jgi:hypothetical protein